MSLFTKHTDATAPKGAAAVLAKAKDRYGFIPNLAATLAESPVTLDAVLNLSGAFDKTSFTEAERQVILITSSVVNGCNYCKTVHAALGRKAGIDDTTLKALVALAPLSDARLNALRDFTKAMVEQRGRIHEQRVRQFLDAGYTNAQVFEVVMGVALKTLTNYSNHLTGTHPNPEFVAMAEPGEKVA
ncbi:MAG: carboxymuconolactone decarboxylase family protein (plasmid) [Nitrospira sp.]